MSLTDIGQFPEIDLKYPQISIMPLGAATYFSVQKPFGSSMIGHRSERFCVFLPIFAGRDGEGNEQKLGEEWGQAKQWKFVLKNPSVNSRSQLGASQVGPVGPWPHQYFGQKEQ